MIRGASAADRESIETLLREAELPLDGVAEHIDSFFVFEESGRTVAVAGIEWYGDDALLRSVVVSTEARAAGLGSLLARRALDEGRGRNARAVYLLTTTAERFFPRFGFVQIDRAEVPLGVQASREFRGACPASATVMRLLLLRPS